MVDDRELLSRRLFLVMEGARVLGVVAKVPFTPEKDEWVPFSLGSERTFTRLAAVASRRAAEKVVRASWGAKP